jgi:serine/threonine-protein kinase
MAEQIYLGRYKVSRQLDTGGMSRIYLARDLQRSRDVVVKVLKPELQAQAKVREHFRREIHIMSRFEHPNVVKYLDAGTHPSAGPVLVMEYLKGVDLGELLHQHGRFTPERAGRLLAQLCDALQATHDAGVIHRDIKPGNLMIVDAGTPGETLKLMDFGLAKIKALYYIAPDELVNYVEPAASGTPEYICPEEVRGTAVDPRSDVYSVGVVLFEMLTGKLPFEGTNPQHLMRCHVDRLPPTFANLGLGNVIPDAIESVVRSCLGKHPDQRPNSAVELAVLYEKALGQRITQFRRGPAPATERMPSLRTREPAPLGATPAPAKRLGPARHAIEHRIEAVMPEALAMVKLKGFIHDLGGDVVESVPGMIRVRLCEQREKKGGFLSWIGHKTTATVAFAELELHMDRPDPQQPNRVTITLVINPGNGLVTLEMRNRCNKIGRDLQAYLLMGR